MSFGNDSERPETADDVVLKVFLQAALRMRVLRAERFRQRRQDDQPIGGDTLAEGIVAGVGDRAAGIVVAVAQAINNTPIRLERRAPALGHQKSHRAAGLWAAT